MTRCPYKGRRATTRSRSGGETGKDLVWYYADPLAEAVRIAGLLCFFNERVDLELDGELQRAAARTAVEQRGPWASPP